jgi:hypothetical protein
MTVCVIPAANNKFHAAAKSKSGSIEPLFFRSVPDAFPDIAPSRKPRFPATIENRARYLRIHSMEESMKKTLAVLATVATLGVTAVSAPAPAEARGLGPGLAFGLAAGAIAAGAAGAYGYYGPGYYGYYGPRYYAPAYYAAGPYAYYGGPYYRHHRYWRHW